MNNNKSGLKYYFYARKSSESEDKQVQSIDDQTKWLRDVKSKKGIKVAETFTESKSAKKPNNRPAFTEMVARLQNGEADGIVCWHFNRLSRNPIDSATIQWLLQEGVIKSVITHDREYLPSDNTLIMSVDSGMSNQYIIELRANTKRGIQSKLEKGWKPGLPPIGYMADYLGLKGEKEVHIDPERYDLVRKIWDYMLTGNYNPMQVLDMATNEWHLATRPSRKLQKRGHKAGVPISQSGIYRLLSNPFYAGRIIYNGKSYEGKHRKMITWSEYERVQELLGAKGKPQPKTREFAYTGNIRCGHCGCLITAETKTKYVKKTGLYKDYTYYRCTRKKINVPCNQKPIRLEDLEPQMDAEIQKFTILPVFRDWALNILNKANDQEIVDRTKIHEALVQQLLETQRQLDTLTQMRYRDLISDEEYMRERKVLQNRLVSLQQERDETETRAKDWIRLTEKTFDFACYARKAFQGGDVRTKREIFAAMGRDAKLTDGKLSLEINGWFKPIAEKYPKLESDYKKVRTNYINEIAPVKAKKKDTFVSESSIWGELWELNPRPPEPQPGALTN